MKKSVLFLFLVMSSVSYAEPLNTQVERIESEFSNCMNEALSTLEFNMCMDESLQQADAERMRVYKHVLAILKEEGAVESKISSLETSEQFWLAVREKKCDSAGADMRGGSGEALLIGECLVSETAEHIRELAEMLNK